MNRLALIVMLCSIASEVLGTTALKLTNGGARPLWYIMVAICYGLAFYLFSQALKSIPLSIAYALWAGLGIIGTGIIGVAFFKQPLSWMSLSGIAVILVGVVLVNLGTDSSAVVH